MDGFSRVRFTVTLVLCTLVVLSTIATWWIERQLGAPIVELATVRATNMATESIHRAVSDVVAARLEGLEAVEYSYDRDGNIVLARFNMSELNRVMADTARAITAELGAHRAEAFELPLGEVTGLTVFAGRGSMIPVQIFAIGAVTAEPKVDFKSAGINQISHRLYIDVNVRMRVIAPFVRDEIVISQSVILAEEILPGRVPETYVHLVGFSGGLEQWMALLEAVDGARGEN